MHQKSDGSWLIQARIRDSELKQQIEQDSRSDSVIVRESIKKGQEYDELQRTLDGIESRIETLERIGIDNKSISSVVEGIKQDIQEVKE